MTFRKQISALLTLTTGWLLSSAVALAHHSVAANFDVDSVVEAQGEVVEVSWRNPHAMFRLRAPDTGAVWTVEMTSLTNLRRAGLGAGQLVNIGETIRVAGNPSRHEDNYVYAENLLLPGNNEVIVEPRGEPRWENEVRGRDSRTGPGDTSAPELGIFRVWSTPRNEPLLMPEDTSTVFDFDLYPLTAAAIASVEAFDRVTDSPILNCVSKGMPTIMQQPYPMEFRRAGDAIEIHIEEYDVVRTVHMDPNASGDDQPMNKLGYSVGRWDGNTLHVRTTRSNWEHFDVSGVPLTPDSEILEEFTVSQDGSRLDYALTITDPATFTEPVTVRKFWAWYPEMTVEPFECLSR